MTLSRHNLIARPLSAVLWTGEYSLDIQTSAGIDAAQTSQCGKIHDDKASPMPLGGSGIKG